MTAWKSLRKARTLTVLISVVLMILPAHAVPTAAAPPTATVVGTEELAILSCPAPDCKVVDRAPLGAAVEVVGEESDAFSEVFYNGTFGYASGLYLATDPSHVPFLVEGEPGCQRVALIFNVGVGFEPATGILDMLDAERVPATMFVMGWWVAEHPPILQRMADAGYPIGSHGNWPQELTELTDDEVAADLANAAEAIEHATGKPPAPLFTPYAAASDERVRAIVAASGYLSVAWNVPAADYGEDATEDSVYRRVMDEMYDGAIVELHLDAPASAESTGRALPRIIRDLRADGYRFVTIPDMAAPCP